MVAKISVFVIARKVVAKLSLFVGSSYLIMVRLEVPDLQSLTLSIKTLRHRCFLVNSAKFLITPLKNPSNVCFCINIRSLYFLTRTFRFVKNDVTQFPSEYFLDLICRLETRVSSVFLTLSRKSIFNLVEHLQ